MCSTSECTPWDIPRVTCIFLVYTQAFLGKCVHKENTSDKWDISMLLAGWEVCSEKLWLLYLLDELWDTESFYINLNTLSQGIILAACTRVHSLNNLALKFFTLPPLEKGFYLLFVNKLGSLLVVWLSLRSDLPQALALLVSCHLISWPLSCPIQPVLCWGDKKGSANTLVLFPY